MALCHFSKGSSNINHILRAITFCLSCFIAFVICIGLIVTVIAGVAFGYNYSFAEFITHTRSDVTIYMKRGQFYDRPDIAPAPHRRMGEEDDLFVPNVTSEYEEEVISDKNSEPLSGKWLKDQDAREYAIKLTKYKGNERIHVDDTELKEEERINPKYMPTLPSTRRLSGIPIVIPTTVWLSDSSQIILRKFLPLQDIRDDFHRKEPENDPYDYNKYKYVRVTRPSEIEYSESEKQINKNEPDIKIRIQDIPERKLLPISNSERNSRNDQDYFIEEESENNIMYKPV